MNTRTTLHDHSLLSPLPRRAAPYSDEDLLSLLRRTASRMGYPDFRWLLRPQGKSWSNKDVEVPLLSTREGYLVLGRLLRLSEEEVYSYTFHRCASLLDGIRGRQHSAESVDQRHEPITPFLGVTT